MPVAHVCLICTRHVIPSLVHTSTCTRISSITEGCQWQWQWRWRWRWGSRRRRRRSLLGHFERWRREELARLSQGGNERGRRSGGGGGVDNGCRCCCCGRPGPGGSHRLTRSRHHRAPGGAASWRRAGKRRGRRERGRRRCCGKSIFASSGASTEGTCMYIITCMYMYIGILCGQC